MSVRLRTSRAPVRSPRRAPRPSPRRAAELAALLATGVLAAARPAPANPLDNFGIHSRNVAMGGAVTAEVGDFGAVYYNPAALVRLRDIEASVGYFHSDPTLELNGRDVNEDATSGLIAGFVTPPFELPFGGIEMGGGALFHLPDKRVARTLAIPFDRPSFVLFGPSNQRAVIMFPFSFGITDWLAVGANLSIFVESSGGPDFILREDRPGNENVFSEGTISAQQKGLFFPGAGALIQVNEDLKVGLNYRTKNEATYRVPLDIRIEALSIFDLPTTLLDESRIDLNQEVISFFAPEQITLGASWRARQDLTLTLDVTYARWSAFQQPAPEGATFISGGLAQLILPNPNFALPPPNFDDVVMPAVGVEWQAIRDPAYDLYLRGGYRFRPTPSPKPTGFNNFADGDTHIFSFGLGTTFHELISVIPGDVDLDVHGQYFMMQDRKSLESNLSADAFGDLVIGGHVLAGGVTLTAHFGPKPAEPAPTAALLTEPTAAAALPAELAPAATTSAPTEPAPPDTQSTPVEPTPVEPTPAAPMPADAMAPADAMPAAPMPAELVIEEAP